MAFNLDNAFGVHAQAIALRSKRMEIIASNLANADTPGYKARDLDFREVMKQQSSGLKTYRTNARHLANAGADAMTGGDNLKYRLPLQPSVDGNTVDPQFEQTTFADNAVRFQASLMFLDGRIRGLSEAITGGLR